MADAIRYSIVPKHPEAHLFEVTVTVDHPRGEALAFALPAWIPGSYLIREFARHIVSIRAESGGRAHPLRKTDKHTWLAGPAQAPITLTYEVYAYDLSVRAAHLDATHGFFNGTGVFLRVRGREDQRCLVDLRKPSGKRYAGWRVATALREARGAGGAKRHGFGLYEAANYDELVDHPVELGTFTLVEFNACGTPHEIAITGPVPKLDIDRLRTDVQQICEAQIRMFEPKTEQAPMDRYVFLTTAVGEGYGGLEHRASTALICNRADLPFVGMDASTDGYRGFLGLVSHEYFHTWNVKRIKPAAFAPYDLDREVTTNLLWIFEGFTSYYDDLVLVRAGLLSEEQYLAALSKTINTVLGGSGRLKQSVAESSFDAWIKYYRQDENSPNAVVSYYQKGSLVALALDLTIRAQTKGKKSLDDVMRALWRDFGRAFYLGTPQGLGEDEFVAVAERATGVSLARQVREWAYGTRDIPLARLLAPFGVDDVPESSEKTITLGVKTEPRAGACRIVHAYDDGPAQSAGLSADDTLVAIDDLRINASNLDSLLARYAAGDRVRVHAFRRDELHAFDVELTLAKTPVRLCVDSRAGAGKARLRKRWLGRSR